MSRPRLDATARRALIVDRAIIAGRRMLYQPGGHGGALPVTIIRTSMAGMVTWRADLDTTWIRSGETRKTGPQCLVASLAAQAAS